MPAPHPLAARVLAGGVYRDHAIAELLELLEVHHGSVREAAKHLDPAVHETTLHDWLTAWGIRPEKKKSKDQKKET